MPSSQSQIVSDSEEVYAYNYLFNFLKDTEFYVLSINYGK